MTSYVDYYGGLSSLGIAGRSGAHTIELYMGESPTVTWYAVDDTGDGIIIDEMTALELRFETRFGESVETIAADGLTLSGTSFEFVVPDAVTASRRTLKWLLWNTEDDTMLMTGLVSVV